MKHLFITTVLLAPLAAHAADTVTPSQCGALIQQAVQGRDIERMASNSVQADQIATLTAQLAEARKELAEAKTPTPKP